MILFSGNILSRHDDEDEEEATDTGIDDALLEELEEDDIADESLVEGEPFPVAPIVEEEEEEDGHGLEDEFLGAEGDDDEEDMDYDSFDDQDDL